MGNPVSLVTRLPLARTISQTSRASEERRLWTQSPAMALDGFLVVFFYQMVVVHDGRLSSFSGTFGSSQSPLVL